MTSENWAAHFANRLKYQWTSTHLRGSPPFAPLKRSEAFDYAALHATDRYSRSTLQPILQTASHSSHTLSFAMHTRCSMAEVLQRCTVSCPSGAVTCTSLLQKKGMIPHYLCWSCVLVLQAWVVKGQTAHVADADLSCQCLLTEVCLAQPISAAQVLPVCNDQYYTMSRSVPAA